MHLRHSGQDAETSLPYPPAAAKGAAPRHHSPRHHRPPGTGKGTAGGSQRADDQPFPGGGTKKYALYDNKICMKEDAAQTLDRLNKQVEATGYRIVRDRGDYPGG